MKLIITGATGFVGGALARALIDEGATVFGLARGRSVRPPAVDLPVQWREGDVTDPNSLSGLFNDTDWVIHAAGMLGQAGVPEASYQQVHVAGTRHVLAEAQRAGVKGVLYVSSPGVLGPIDGPPADETAPLAPSNPYERSKAEAERVALRFAAEGLPVVVVRPEFIYGPGDRHVLGLFRAVQRRLFFYVDHGCYHCHPTFIDDAVAGMLLALRCGRAGEIYHVVGPRPVAFRELATTIASILDVPAPRLFVPRRLAGLGATGLELLGRLTGLRAPLSRTAVAFFSENRRFSYEKAHRELGYKPRVDLPEGVQRTVAWYRERGLMT